MTVFSKKYIPECIKWCLGGGFVFSIFLTLCCLPVAQYMSNNLDPAPLIPLTITIGSLLCLYYTVSAYICLGKVMRECTELPVDPKKWFMRFTLIQVGMRFKEAVSKYYNYRSVYNTAQRTLSPLSSNADARATQEYLAQYYSNFNKAVLIMLIVSLLLTAASYPVLYSRFRYLAGSKESSASYKN